MTQEVSTTYQNENLYLTIDFEEIRANNFNESCIGNNLFVEPYQELWKKILGTGFYMIQLLGGLIMFTIIGYEKGFGHFRTALNQLTSWKFMIVRWYFSANGTSNWFL